MYCKIYVLRPPPPCFSVFDAFWFSPSAFSFISLDASRPWMIYWILHALDLLDHFPQGEMVDRILQTVLSCQVTKNQSYVQVDTLKCVSYIVR